MNSAYKRSVFMDAAKVANLTYQIGETGLLREPSSEVGPKEINAQKIRIIIAKLKRTLNSYKKLTGKGRGIAAVQIGISLRVAVLFYGKDFLTIINPQIIEKSDMLLIYPEICMSANPIIAKVIRPAWVKVKYLNESGNEKFWDDKKDKITNRVLQHEIDHMEGIINIDHAAAKDLILDSNPGYFKNARFERIPRTRQ